MLLRVARSSLRAIPLNSLTCTAHFAAAANAGGAALTTADANVYSSPYRVSIPEQSVTSFMLERCTQYGDATAFVDGANPTNKITFAQLPHRIGAAAQGFRQAGLGAGDITAIALSNCPEYAVAFHGIASCGGIVTTLNPVYTEAELSHQLKDSGAVAIVTSQALLPTVQAAAGRAGITRIFVLGTASGAFLNELGPAVIPVAVDAKEQLLVIPYSSGTTGLPKGVKLTHHNLVANICQTTDNAELNCGVRAGDAVIGLLPFQHIYGMEFLMLGSIKSGATVVTLPRFDPVQFLETLQHFRITVAPLVPPIIGLLAKHPMVDKYDLSSIRFIFSGAAPLDAATQAAAAKRIGTEVRQGYGLTESSPVTHMVLSADSVPGTAGRLVANMEAKICNDDGVALLPGPKNRGEVLLRGPNIMKGYLNNPAATAATINLDGWLCTGDIGWRDERGNFYIVDRKKELIKVKGYQVAPAELEGRAFCAIQGILMQHPGIMDVAVVQRADERSGEVPVAFVVRRAAPAAPGSDPTPPVSAEDVKRWVADRAAEYKQIADVRFIDVIPKATSGKILRRVLRDLL